MESLEDVVKLAEKHHLSITIRGDGSIIGTREDLQKLRTLLALRPLLAKSK